MQIRPVEQKDKEQYFRLFAGYLEFYKTKLDDKVLNTTWDRFFDDSEPVYAAVAYDEADPSKLIGLTTWLYHRTTWQVNKVIYLHDLYVDPDCRLKGTGRALIEYVGEQAKANEVKKIYWHTQHFNHRAQLLYTKVAKKNDMVSYEYWP